MKSRKTKEQFEHEAKHIHGDRFDYSQVVYKNNHTPVAIVCRKHGIFFQRPEKHLLGNGCKFCSRRITHPVDFVEQANAIHNNKYDYALVINPLMKSPIQIICDMHGVFEQRAEVHLRGSGCPTCHRVTGSSIRGRLARIREYKNIDAIFYIVVVTIDGICYNKIGITTQSIEKRFMRCVIEPILLAPMPLQHAMYVEQEMLNRFQEHRQQFPLPINGWTEIINQDLLTIKTEYSKIGGGRNGTI